jgi:multidrug efflux pump
MAFTDIFIKRPVLSLVVSLLILLIGFKAATSLGIRQYPKLSNTVVTITTSYPGASPNLMQGFITQPIEQAVASAEGVDYITSSSVQGLSTISVYIKLNVDPNSALTEVSSKVSSVRYLIPRESNDPVITKSTGQTTAVMYIGFASDELTGPQISDYLARVVQPILSTVDGVASADILGAQTLATRIWLNPERMASRNVSPDDVGAAIRANNFQAAAGQSKGYFIVSNVTTNTDLTSIEQFKRMTVKAKDGGFVRLEDIATVELGAQSTDASVAMSGQQAIFIGVQSTPQGNPLNIVKGVRALFPEIERNLPPSLKMRVAYDSTKFIQSSIDEVRDTLLEAVLIVVVVIFLFLASLRSVIIPVVTIPLSLVGACILMLAMGFTLNLLTLLAMVLAIGLVVDDAIVVVENIHRHLEEGKTPVEASLIGAREIVGPVISMTITLAAVYAPIGFLGGLTGSLFREFAFTLAGSVIISGVVALTLSPMMCSVLLKGGHQNQGRFAKLVDRVFTRVTRLVWTQAGPLAGLSADHWPVRRGDPVPRRLHVCEHQQGTGAGGRSGHSVLGDQSAAICEHRLQQFLRQETGQGFREFPRNRSPLHHQRHQWTGQRYCGHDPEAVGRAQAVLADAQTIGSERTEQGGGRQRLCVQSAGFAGRPGRFADPDGHQHDERIPGCFRADGEAEEGCARKRLLHRG